MNKLLNSYRKYVVNYEIKPVRPSDKAKILFGYNISKVYQILTDLGIEQKNIDAIKSVADGNTYVEVSKQFNCSADTIRNWINRAYSKVLNS